jgi:hypothetical protein
MGNTNLKGWNGHWKSDVYPMVYGTISLNYDKTLESIENMKIEATISYAYLSIYKPGQTVKMLFDVDLDKNTKILSMKTKYSNQEISYESTLTDLGTTLVKGSYSSHNPYDQGSFEINYVQ